jgi:alkyl sulfatase BDS1-like metallo-beta-lactamase superfamily hydrolase
MLSNTGPAGVSELDWGNRQDFDDATRGLVRGLPNLVIRDGTGTIVWDSRPHDSMLSLPRPDSVHPSLWRLAQLNNIRGLFKVCDSVWQVRGHSLANMTFVEGETGWIVIDPCNTLETATVGMDLVTAALGHRPVVGLVYSHSHSDHWGGAAGVRPTSDAIVVAPQGFEQTILAESLVASEGLGPRNNYMYGELLQSGPCGHVDCGLGKATEGGRVTFVPPTHHVGPEGSTLTIDGIDFEFQSAPGEAPVGIHVYLPKHRVLHIADNCYASLHNVYTIRGSQSRDAALWSSSVDRALEFIDAEIVIGGHHWPRWGAERVRRFMTQQRDALKYLHDQSVRLMKLGFTAHEAANVIALPPELARQWHLRGYYGTIAQNVRGIIHHYLGWYDGNPATLHPLPPREMAAKMIGYMGGAAAVVERAEADLVAGNLRWVVQIMDHLLWLEPDNGRARALAAQAHTKLGLASENATWRNAHLSAAQELAGLTPLVTRAVRDSSDLSAKVPTCALFDYLGVRVIGEKAAGLDLRCDWHVTDRDERFATRLHNGVLSLGHTDPAPVTIALDHLALSALIYQQAKPENVPLTISGDESEFARLWSVMQDFPTTFSLATHSARGTGTP